MKHMKHMTLLLAAAALLTGCTMQDNRPATEITGQVERTEQAEQLEQLEETAQADESAQPYTAEAAPGSEKSAGESIAEMLGVTDYKAPWKREDYPEMGISDMPAKGAGTVKMALMPYSLDDVCVYLLAEDAYADGEKVYCTSMKLGLLVSGVEQDIIEVPQDLAAPDGTFEFDPLNEREQVGCMSMPDVYFGVNSFSGESAAGCEYYTISRNEETHLYALKHCGYTDERCRMTPDTMFTLPPEKLSGEYGLADAPAIVSCDGTLTQEEALNHLAVEYINSFKDDDPDRTFKLTDEQNVSARVLGSTMDFPVDGEGQLESPWNTLETWEISNNTWLVAIDAEIKGEGVADSSIGTLDPEQWYDLPYGGFPPRCFLMYNDGSNWYLWSRNAYRCLPGVLK